VIMWWLTLKDYRFVNREFPITMDFTGRTFNNIVTRTQIYQWMQGVLFSSPLIKIVLSIIVTISLLSRRHPHSGFIRQPADN